MQQDIDIAIKQQEDTDPTFTKWSEIIADIEKGKCCLVLGPELRSLRIKKFDSVANKNIYNKITVFEAFSNYLDECLIPYQINRNIKSFYYKANKLILNKYLGRPFDFRDEIKCFRETYLNSPTAIHRFLARLPFSSIVNVVPDNLIGLALRDYGYDFVEEYYNYRGPEVTHTEELVDEIQFVYNLFGTYNNPKSIAITENDEFQLIKSLTSDSPKVNNSLTGRFSDVEKSFLFLGFNFNEWYFRLVIDALKIDKPALSVAPKFNSDHNVAFLTREYYNQKYSFGFVRESTESFIKNLVINYNKVSPINKKLKIVLDFSGKEPSNFFKAFKMNLLLNPIEKRAEIWDKSEITHGSIEETVEEKIKEADLFIPFLNNEYLIDKLLFDRVVRILNSSSQKVITIKENYCTETKIPNLSKASLQLPKDIIALSSTNNDNELNKKCQEIIFFINCIVR